MTTIVYRDGVMAADSGSWAGDASHGWAEKVVRGVDDVLYGCAGDAAEAEGFLAWVRSGYRGEPPKPEYSADKKESSFIVLIARPGERVGLRSGGGEERYEAPYYAIGAGASVAFGALFMGATAEQAIEAAKEHGIGAFGRVRTVKHSG
jgi:hypothetical protein